MEKLNRMLKSFFWLAVLPPIIMLFFVMYYYGINHLFGLVVFALVCMASLCANAYRIRKEIQRINASFEAVKDEPVK